MITANTAESLRTALAALEAERDRIDQGVLVLNQLIAEGGAEPARVEPAPSRSTPARATARTAGRRKPRWTPAMRAAARARMQKFWARKRRR